MKVVFIADPSERLKPAADSTLAMLREAMRRGHEAYWSLAEGVEYVDGWIHAAARRCTECGADELPKLAAPESLRLADTGAVFIRKDPPFDAGYLRLCWLLALEEPRVRMFNRPSLLSRYHEKLVPLEALAEGFLTSDDLIATHIGPLESSKRFARQRGYARVIVKPFLGYGGNRVYSMTAQEFQQWAPRSDEREELMVQPFEEAILSRGDRRVFFLDGKRIGDFVRMPAAGNFVSNLAQGGSAVSMPLERDEAAVLDRLGKFLARAGIVFAGADLIGRKISEVNITSPTGIRSILTLEGRDISRELWDSVERQVRSSRAAS